MCIDGRTKKSCRGVCKREMGGEFAGSELSVFMIIERSGWSVHDEKAKRRLRKGEGS